MSLDDEEYSSVSWDTGATDSFKPEDLLDEVVEETSQDLDNSTFSAINNSIFSTLAPSTINHSNSNDEHNDNRHSTTDSYVPSITVPIACAMTITVTDPIKELDGTKDAFISYLLTTKTTLDTFTTPTVVVRRRFQDFVWLHNSLSRDFAACVIPPLPDKHRLEYITGDRFGPEFVEKRRASLQRLLERLARHPTLQKSEYFRIFLESREWNAESLYRQKKSNDGVFENLGDVLLNAFSRIKKPDERFVEIKESVDKLEENLQTIDRLYFKIIKRQTDLESDYREFGTSIVNLGQLETGISTQLENFGEAINKFSDAWKQMTDQEELEYLNQIREFLSYCHCIKNVLKLRDQKQVDFEELSEYLQGARTEKENIISTGKGSMGLSSFLREKVDYIKNVDQEQAKKERIQKLDAKINELSKEVESSNDISEKFSEEVAKEYEIFQTAKTVELKECLLAYTDRHVEFYRQGMQLWKEIIPILEGIKN
ncbi:5132_t:CDS:10 [Funneliformis geosporum]|uniref:Sorting nexin-4 n=1 Tax=Funneliformis geosporum TaxID=1117311 RepID=A0A9W4SG13_9GLOM|nr:4427_t:CDS:10 [Funneliformis geosporum]CAI2168706.1 5132_t:CDS:10 [Funneliformis geosporum]